ncbi:histidine phosphatase family protein [Pseudonocardia sp. KRD-184]|uniref:Histidine phosphatase family protein n=1 Tax=Pseudonocardia oceani TaxID=2792013 RepID=A0ABS6U308_9PSEU|nr:histidine phosphatase family protein [Pseudonocardia oceani]MBW0092374.1 histidine phosphatase family protein [Pseudonocardia oceani]MBW0099149.1 histidine phosphatase family protein [Pseudonocardia oceani]MBW0125464.1 histidine phosphatase family protein [Pseudonocardia oceani]MBW0126622.1 histidine phosphatase family protein [Pseudonocardia oceani]
MNGRVTLVCHSSTSATNAAAFAADEPLDARGARWATEARGRLTRADRVLCGPGAACRQTAEALGLSAKIEPALGDWDLGRWRGRTLDEVAADESDAVTAWLSEPDAAPHGGEAQATLLARVAAWLAEAPGEGHTVVVTHAAVVRAVLLSVLHAPPTAFWRIDIAPLTATRLRGGPGRWTIRSTATPLR